MFIKSIDGTSSGCPTSLLVLVKITNRLYSPSSKCFNKLVLNVFDSALILVLKPQSLFSLSKCAVHKIP